ncbi:MAG: hypothetical protein P1P89_21850 [Desulfobacterales bacterium]|nr:hypothetical protein [Desulfobacterales bacterium]
MDTEFHYYMTGIIANAAGFSEAEARIIATASEYVDENDVCLTVEDRSSGNVYENYISQTMNILKPKRKLMRIYPVFHFVPGDPMSESACRCDGKMHLLNTTPDNELANKMIDLAFKASEDTRLYRIGIAVHAYADTWAHQNFVGWYDFFNDIALDVKPDIGHANAEHHPDWPAHRWEDPRLVKDEIDNSERFLSAAKEIYGKYQNFNKKRTKKANATWKKVSAQLIQAMGASFSGNQNYYHEDRLERYRELAPWLGDFDESDWFSAAIDTKVQGLKDSESGLLSMFTMLHDKLYWKEGTDKEKTHWFRFQEAVKEHQAKAMEDLDVLFARMGVDLHAV